MKKNYFKKYTALLMASAIAVGVSACTKSSDNTANNDTKTEQSAEKNNTADGTDFVIDETSENALPEDAQNMIEPMEVIMTCMIENNYLYDAENPDFFWTAVHYMCGICGLNNAYAVVDTEKGTLTMPKEDVIKYAQVAFATYNDLYEIPDSLKDSVKYDKDSETYIFSIGDKGITEPVMNSVTENGDGTYTVAVDLMDPTDNTLIAECEFVLAENTNADENSEYKYSIKSAKLTNTEGIETDTENQ